MIDQASVPSLMGSTVRDSAGEKIGKVGQVYLDDTTGQPEWVTVRTGLFGTKESFVPLAAARVEGDELVVEIPKAKVHDAPRIDEEGHLSEEQETELYTYYGVSQGPFGRQTPSGTAPGSLAGDAVTGSVAGSAAGDGLAGEGLPGERLPGERPAGERLPGEGGPGAGVAGGGLAAGADPTGTPLGDQDVAQAMGGSGFTETDAETGADVGPDFARGEDDTATGVGGGTDSGPDFARGEDASVTGRPSAAGPDFARGSDLESGPGDSALESGPAAGRGRLRRWLVSDEQTATPVVDETGEVIGEVRTERVDLRPLDEDEDETR
jgi:sporulation protein YlmC with PRC-barrel domain